MENICVKTWYGNKGIVWYVFGGGFLLMNKEKIKL